MRRLAATALTAAVVAVPTISATSADAASARAGTSWSTIARWSGATQQACTVSIRGGSAVRIYTRLVNGHQAKVGAGLSARKGEDVSSTWRSPLIAKGRTSK